MASILRSSKFVRYIAGFARNVVINTPREFDGNFINTTQCFCGAVPRSFANQASAAHHEQNLDRSLRKLDNDVKRSGRLSRRDIEEVLEELRQTRTATSSQSLLVIRCCGNLVPEELPEIRTQLVQEIWNTLRNLHVPMDVSHYNALLRVYLENEHTFSPTDFLSEMESIGVEPNRVTYQRLIARYCQEGDIEGATKILEFMREKQLPVNEHVFNALINGHSKAGDMDSAMGILSVMSQAGLEPTADTYTTLMCGYAAQGDIEKINELLNTCETKEIYILDKDLLEIVHGLIVNGHSQYVSTILAKTHKAFGYVQDSINTILKLINKGFLDESWTILESFPRQPKNDGSFPPVGRFFIKQMVRANCSKEKILEYCDKLDKTKMFSNGLMLAVEASLQLGNEELSYQFLEHLQSQGIQVKQHFFWPLIVSKAKDDNGDAIIKVLQEMARFNVTPTSETIRDYVIPNIKGNAGEIISKLREANISVGSAATNLVFSLLNNNELDEAAIIATRIPAYYSPDFLKKVLTSSFVNSHKLESYIKVLRSIHDNLGKQPKNEEGDSTTQRAPHDRVEVVDRFLLDLAANVRNFADSAPQILDAFVNEGFTISTKCAEKVEARLGDKMTPNISSQLGRLASGDLTLSIVDRQPMYTPSSQMNAAQLERLVANLDAKKQDTKGLKRQLLTLYHRSRDLEKTEQLLSSFQEGEFEMTAGVYAQLADLYAHHGNLEKTLECCEKLHNLDEKFTLDDQKMLRIAHLLFQHEMYDQGLEMLNKPKAGRNLEDRSFTYNSLCWRLLNAIADQGKTDELNTIFNTMVQNEFIEVSNVLLGPLVKVHIVRGELDLALEKFEWCCNQFKATPWKNDLMCKLIAVEDAEKLQKLTDLSTAVHGEINSLYDLVFAFVECGRVRQARKILETPGLQSRPQKINNVCQRYQEEGMVKPLEGLIDATKDLNHIDRGDIYYQLLRSYIKQEDTDKANGLWLQMQEEGLIPSEPFLATLGNFLKQNNLVVPFIIPQIEKPSPQANSRQQQRQEVISAPRKDTAVFREAVRINDFATATNMFANLQGNLIANEVSILIEKLCQNNREIEGAQIAMAMLKKGQVPIARVFRFLLNKLASNGQVHQIEQIGNLLDSEQKKVVSFDNRICHAYLKDGKADQYLDALFHDIESAKEDDLKILSEKFPRGGAVGILDQHPELLPKYEILAKKYASRGIVAPMNVLWSHYFTLGNYETADSLWNEHLQNTPRIMFQRVVQHARENNDLTLIQKLVEHLKISQVTEGALGNAYSCLLDIACTKAQPKEVVSIFESTIKEVSIHSINRTAVVRVKSIYDQLGQAFNHKIPAKTNAKPSSSSSSSNSSEEDDNKK